MTVTPVPGQRLRRRPAVSQKARAGFLELLSCGWSITHAAERVGSHRNRFYELRDADEDFAAAWAHAYEAGTDVLRDEARRRAVDGWDEPVYQGGQLAGHVRKFSDVLLIFELKRRDPSYRDNFQRVELTGVNGGPVELHAAAGYEPPTLGDMVRLAGELGVLEQLGYARVDVVEGEAVDADLVAIEVAS